MLPARLRTCAGAAALAITGALLFAVPAQAADTTITLSPADVAFFDEPLQASGTCTDGSRTAVVTVTQGGDVVDQVAADLDASLAYSVQLDLSSGSTDLATARVECFRYPDAAPVGSSEAQFFLAADDLPIIDVTVSPTKVRIGGTLTISATCPAGTTEAEVMAGSEELDAPFLDETVTPAADGSVSVTTTVKPGEFTRVGDAIAVVACGENPELPTAVGFADFSILAAVAAPAAAPAAPATPASAVPQLANTGSDNGPLAAIGLGFVLAGAGAYRLRRGRARSAA